MSVTSAFLTQNTTDWHETPLLLIINPFAPLSRTVDVPFPTSRLASTALQALQVDKELSSLVTRSFSLATSDTGPETSVLRAHYKATTNRMLRVAVNSFMESLSLIIEVMGELDEDVVAATQHST